MAAIDPIAELGHMQDLVNMALIWLVCLAEEML